MVPLGMNDRRWSLIRIHFITYLPPLIIRNDLISVVMIRLSKMVHAIPGKNSEKKTELCFKVFVVTVYISHWIPLDIVSDRDTILTSDF